MRRMIVGLGLLVIVSAGGHAANPGDAAAPGTSDRVQSQAKTYATQMAAIARHISEAYVRPIDQARIVEAALEGLYEAVLEPLPAWVRADLANAKSDDQLRHVLATARERLGEREALRDPRAIMISLRAISRVLDSHCGIVDPYDRRAYGNTSMTGVGLDFETSPVPFPVQQHELDAPVRPPPRAGQRGPARVSVVYPGSPAQRAGVRPGDVLTHIDGKALESIDGGEQFQRLFTEDETNRAQLKLTFRRIGADKPLNLELTPITFRVESVFGVRRRLDHDWDYLLDRERHIGYVRLGFIDHSSDEEMNEVLRGLKGQGLRGLIFDLRGNPGGFVDPAKEIAGLFVKSGTVAVVTDRQEGPTRHSFDNGSALLEGIPTIVLIDGETKGGGEMIAAVLQDYKLARIAGQRSFGKGSVQKTIYFREQNNLFRQLDNLQYKLTTGSFTRPNGKNLHRFPDSKPTDDWGIRPDPGLDFPVPPDLAKQIKDWMQQQTLRPGPCRDVLPLDDPDNDPLRQFAWRLLVKQVK